MSGQWLQLGHFWSSITLYIGLETASLSKLSRVEHPWKFCCILWQNFWNFDCWVFDFAKCFLTKTEILNRGLLRNSRSSVQGYVGFQRDANINKLQYTATNILAHHCLSNSYCIFYMLFIHFITLKRTQIPLKTCSNQYFWSRHTLGLSIYWEKLIKIQKLWVRLSEGMKKIMA